MANFPVQKQKTVSHSPVRQEPLMWKAKWVGFKLSINCKQDNKSKPKPKAASIVQC